MYMGAVLKPLFTFYMQQEHVISKIRVLSVVAKDPRSTAKGPAKGYHNLNKPDVVHRCGGQGLASCRLALLFHPISCNFTFTILL